MAKKAEPPVDVENLNAVILDMYKRIVVMEQTSQQVRAHNATLYGQPDSPEAGLVWKISQAEKDISLIKKVAFALVPGTGAVWVIAEFLAKAFLA